MEPARYDINIYKSRDFVRRISLENTDGTATDLTGYSFAAQLREKRERSSALIADFVIDLTGISDGVIQLMLSDDTTGAITQTRGWYDVEVTEPSGYKFNYIWGKAYLLETVTL